jgi:hypothetical protein
MTSAATTSISAPTQVSTSTPAPYRYYSRLPYDNKYKNGKRYNEQVILKVLKAANNSNTVAINKSNI